MSPSVVETYREIVASLTAAGGPFEMETRLLCGRAVRAFRQAPRSLEDHFAEAAEAFPDEVLLVQEGREHTYGQVFRLARRLAGSLQDDFGVRAGDRVGVVMRNRLEYFVALFAAARIGAVAVLFNGRGAPAELRTATEDVPCTVIVADDARAARLRDGGCRIPLVVTCDPGAVSPEGAADFAELIAAGRREADAIPAEFEDPAWILFTSGTSGRAKGAVLTQANVCNMLKNLDLLRASGLEYTARKHGVPVAVLLQHAPPMSVFLVYPMFHVSGLTAMASALMSGGRMVAVRRWNSAEAARLIAEHKVTSLSGPPLVVQDLLELPGASALLATVTQAGVGGQATPPNLPQRMREVMPQAGQGGGWGMTEAVGGVCSASGDGADVHPVSAGWTSPLMDVRTVDPLGKVLPQGETGELQLRGVLIMQGYFGRPEATAEAFDGDWYRTGDVGRVDADGFIYIVDRLTDMVISGGENIYCAEVENALVASDQFAEVAMFGVPDARLGERTVAAVTLREGTDLTAEDIKALAASTLADYKVPTEIVFDLGPFPRTATGKIEKRKLRSAYLAALCK
ncbi:class I adenylate-forming enzyme family protein [Actinomadura scrupuli]|uniref:class I adenylate-forming enzyme family protein n=1 Tax=Actinomadura scrupuli TaxID=559629 RepID=UPI003D98C143